MKYFKLFFLKNVDKVRPYIALFLAAFLFFVISNLSSISYFLGSKSYGIGKYSFYNLDVAQKFFYISANTRDFNLKNCNLKSLKNFCLEDKPVQWSDHQLARTYFVQGEFSQALFYINRELELYPQSLQAHYVKALILGYTNNELGAIDEFTTFANVYKDAWAPRNDKAWLQFRIGDYDGALKTINEIADKYKDNAWVQNTLAVMLMNTSKSKADLEKAKEAFALAFVAANKMTEKDWGDAYTGNDPRVYFEGLTQMKRSIQDNLNLVDKKIADSK